MAQAPPSRDRPRPTIAEDTLSGIVSRIRASDSVLDEHELRRHIDAAFARHHGRLQRLVASELGGFSPQQVEDTVQDVMVTAWTKLSEHHGGSFRAWLFGIAMHTCANVRRKRREALPGEDLFEPASEAASAYRSLRRAERQRLLRDAAAILDPTEREVVHLRYARDLGREEIAALLGLADADAVRVLLQRSRRAFVRELEARLAALGHGQSLLDEGSIER